MKILLCFSILTLTFAENLHTYFWRDYRGVIPEDAINGTVSLYIAQIPYNGLLPATLYPDKKEAATECQGKKLVMNTGIKILCDVNKDSFSWEYININSLKGEKLNDLVVGGIEDNGTLYIGKVFHDGEWKIGKVFPLSSQWKGMRTWNSENGLHIANDFQVLKYTTQPVHIFNVRTGA